jgi:hypothetical protein
MYVVRREENVPHSKMMIVVLVASLLPENNGLTCDLVG